MDRFNALGRGAQIMLIAGVLLLIDTFLPWQDFEVGGVDIVSWNAWHGFLGVVMGLLVIVLLAWLVVRLASVDIPLPVSTAMTAALLGTLIVFFAVVKNLADEESTIWSYAGVVLAIIVAYGAFQTVQEAGGIDTLKSEIPSSTPSTTTTSAAAPPPTADRDVTPAPVETAPPASETLEPEPEPESPAEPERPYDPDERRDV